MKLIDIFQYAWNDLLKTKVSFGSNIIAISIGIVLITLMLALSFGISNYVKEELGKESSLTALRVFVEKRNPQSKPIDEDRMKVFDNFGGVEHVVPFFRTYVDAYTFPERKTLIILVGAVPDDPEVTRQGLYNGTHLTKDGGYELVIPINVAKEIDPFNPTNLVGSEITLDIFRKKEGKEYREPIKARVVGLLAYSPQGRVYGSLHLVKSIKQWQDWKFDNLKEVVLEEKRAVRFSQSSSQELRRGGVTVQHSIVTGESGTNMRSEPIIKSKNFIGLLPRGTVVEVLDPDAGESSAIHFAKILFGEADRFVALGNIRPVIKVEVNIHKERKFVSNITLIGLEPDNLIIETLQPEPPTSQSDSPDAVFIPIGVAQRIMPYTPEMLIGQQIDLGIVRQNIFHTLMIATVADVFNPADKSLPNNGQVYGWSDFAKKVNGEKTEFERRTPVELPTTYDSVVLHFNTIENLKKQRPHIESSGYGTSSILDEVKRIGNYVRVAQVIVVSLGLIALIVGSIGIWNTLYASVVQKTKEIGIIKALGGSEWVITLIFLTEAAIIGIFAGICGYIVGALLIAIANTLLGPRLGTTILIHSMWLPFAAVIISLSISLVAAWKPSRVAGKKEAMEAIRSL